MVSFEGQSTDGIVPHSQCHDLTWLVGTASDLVASFLLGMSSAVCTRQRLHLHAFAFLLGPPSARGCSAYGPGQLSPRQTCLRLIPGIDP